MRRKSVICIAVFTFLLTWLEAAVAEPSIIRLATTTSTANSGLLEELLPAFEKESGIKVHVIAVGTGKALRMAEHGDVDMVMVHAPEAEERFVRAAHGVNRRQFMVNDFVIVGPPNDPADVSKAADAPTAFGQIAESRSRFISRGDDSGTHKKERQLWKAAELNPEGNWYMEAGQGMGRVLQMSAEMGAYTLTDRGTWLAHSGKLPLQLLFQGDETLANPYGVMVVNPDRFADVNYTGSMQLLAWLTSPRGQYLIRGFRINGQALFIPTAVTR